jgi:energy-converting hydrogenase Eha subunit E
MTWLQFIASIASSLAWPFAMVAVVFILRNHLIALLRRIAEISLPGGYKVIFAQALHEGRAALSEIKTEPNYVGRKFTTDSAAFSLTYEKALEGVSLVSQMLLAYDEIIALLFEIREIIGAPNLKLPGEIARELVRQKLVSSAFVDAFDNLQNARNAVIHIPELEVTPVEAIEFVSQAGILSEYLKTLKQQKTSRKPD